jgi:hypothetical protein
MTNQAKKYKICYQVAFETADPDLQKKLLILRKDPDNIVSSDADVKDFIYKVVTVAENDSL